MTKSSNANTILSFVVGAAVGATVAMLFAPKSGEELRDYIADEVHDDVRHVQNAGKDIKRRAQQTAKLAQDHLQDAVETGEEAYNRAKKA